MSVTDLPELLAARALAASTTPNCSSLPLFSQVVGSRLVHMNNSTAAPDLSGRLWPNGYRVLVMLLFCKEFWYDFVCVCVCVCLNWMYYCTRTLHRHLEYMSRSRCVAFVLYCPFDGTLGDMVRFAIHMLTKVMAFLYRNLHVRRLRTILIGFA